MFGRNEKTWKAFSSKTIESGFDATAEQGQKSINIIVSSLSCHDRLFLQSVIDLPRLMMAKFDDFYDSRTKGSRMSRIVELFSLKEVTFWDKIDKTIDEVHRTNNWAAPSYWNCIRESISYHNFIRFDWCNIIELSDSRNEGVVRTDVNLLYISARMIDKTKNFCSVSRKRLNTIAECCAFRVKRNHSTEKRFLNPLNPTKKLGQKSKTKILTSNNTCMDEETMEDKTQSNKNKKRRKINASLSQIL